MKERSPETQETEVGGLRQLAKLAGKIAFKGLCWSAGAALVLGPLGYAGWKHFDDTANNLKTSVDDLNRTAVNGIPQIGDRIGSLDNTAKSILPTSTSTSQGTSIPSPNPTEQHPAPADQVAAGPTTVPTETSSTTTTSTTVVELP